MDYVRPFVFESVSSALTFEVTPMTLAISAAWILVVVWLIIRAVRQQAAFQQLKSSPPPRPDAAERVAVIIPARDEAANIGGCVAALLVQDYPAAGFRVVVVDDQSTDGTAEIVAAFAAHDRRLTQIQIPSLPRGWIGKSHACWLGACAVAPETTWLCFMDADIRAEPGLISSAVAAAAAEDLDFLSLAPRQDLHSFAERLIMPCGLILLAFVQNLQQIQSPQGDDATATGQFILIRRLAYHQLGGHAAVRTAICEDAALARTAKRGGFRVAFHGGERLLRTRMYSGWRTLWIGLSKNVVDTLGGPLATTATVLLGTVLAWSALLIPIADATACYAGTPRSCLAIVVALPASVAAFGLHMAGAAFFRIPLWYGVLFPLGYTAGALIGLDSIRRRLSGRVQWKGRIYP